MSKTKRKHRWLYIVLPITGAFIIVSAAAVIASLYISAPTQGKEISKYNEPKSALLVIDVQNDTTSNAGFYGDTTMFVDKVNEAIELAEEKGMEILYIKNEYDGNPVTWLLSMGRYQKGTDGTEFDNRLRVVNQNIFSKSVGDSFSSAEFEAYLIEKEVDTLYIIGADAAACVYSTAMGGLNRGYNVNVVKDAVITVNIGNAMDDILNQYNSDGMDIIDINQL